MALNTMAAAANAAAVSAATSDPGLVVLTTDAAREVSMSSGLSQHPRSETKLPTCRALATSTHLGFLHCPSGTPLLPGQMRGSENQGCLPHRDLLQIRPQGTVQLLPVVAATTQQQSRTWTQSTLGEGCARTK